MNYLSHGYRFLDNPHKLAGTAVPDWLSVVDRKVRIRTHRVHQHIGLLDGTEQSLAEGMLQHLRDDDLFHRCPTFMMLESELSVRFRRLMPDPYDHRPPFLGHIVVELLLDWVISEQVPEVLEDYYQALGEVSPQQIEQLVNRLASRSTDRLAEFVSHFHSARILFDYADDQRLFTRLNQVLRRVTLPPLEEHAIKVFREARQLLLIHAADLLTAVEDPEIPAVSNLRAAG